MCKQPLNSLSYDSYPVLGNQKPSKNTFQATTFKVEENSMTFKDLHRNLRTFRGLPLKFKNFSRLWEACLYHMMSTHNDAGDVSSTSPTNSGYDGGNLQSMQSRTKWEELKEKATQGSHSSCQRGGSLQKWLAHPQSFRKQRRSSKKGPIGDSKRMYKEKVPAAN